MGVGADADLTQSADFAGLGIAAANSGSVKSRRQQSGGPQGIDRAGRPVMPMAMSAPSG